MEQYGPLPPYLHRVFAQLMTDKSQKHIAHDLHCSLHTIESYVEIIASHYGVSGRVSLMAMEIARLRGEKDRL